MSDAVDAEQAIRVVIVDDHPMLRAGTQRLIDETDGLRLVGSAATGWEALALVRQRQPDVLVLDVRLPDISGVEVARRVRQDQPRTAILVLTGYDDVAYLRALLKMGVRGYLRKSASDADIAQAIRTVAGGRAVLEADAAPMALSHGADELTPRELQVLQLVAAGMRNAEVGTALNLTTQTVEFHIHNLLQKLGARSRVAAIAAARERGLA